MLDLPLHAGEFRERRVDGGDVRTPDGAVEFLGRRGADLLEVVPQFCEVIAFVGLPVNPEAIECELYLGTGSEILERRQVLVSELVGVGNAGEPPSVVVLAPVLVGGSTPGIAASAGPPTSSIYHRELIPINPVRYLLLGYPEFNPDTVGRAPRAHLAHVVAAGLLRLAIVGGNVLDLEGGFPPHLRDPLVNRERRAHVLDRSL